MYKSIFELTVKRLTIDAMALNADCPMFKTWPEIVNMKCKLLNILVVNITDLKSVIMHI